MKRWNVVLPEYTLKLYYQDYETAKIRNSRAISIVENFDYAYLEYVEKIKSAAKEILYDYKGRKLYKIPYNSAYILVRLLMSFEDGKEYYYDGCEFQRHDEHTFTVPITWTISTPEEFYTQFLADSYHVELPIEFVSLREIKALKAVKFYNKNSKVFYKDSNGYFYFGDKTCFPNKKDRDEFQKFNGSTEAVRAKLYENDYHYKTKWFLSEAELIQEFDKMIQKAPASYPQPFYEITKRGYAMRHPEDREVIIRLPYFRLEKEIEYERKEHTNEKSVSHWVARKWCGMMEGYRLLGDAFDSMGWVEDLVTRWHEYTLSNNSNSKLPANPIYTIQQLSF